MLKQVPGNHNACIAPDEMNRFLDEFCIFASKAAKDPANLQAINDLLSDANLINAMGSASNMPWHIVRTRLLEQASKYGLVQLNPHRNVFMTFSISVFGPEPLLL